MPAEDLSPGTERSHEASELHFGAQGVLGHGTDCSV